MKKYFVLALVLAAFVVAPVMADVTLSGQFRLGAMWDISEGHYLARLDATRINFNSKIDDYNTFFMEYRGARNREIGTVAGVTPNTANGQPPRTFYGSRYEGGNREARGKFGDSDYAWVGVYVHRVYVTTDWAKYFEFADVVGIKSEVGYAAFGTNAKLSYGIWGIGSPDPSLQRDFGGALLFDIMGIVKPYAKKAFYAYDGTGDASFVVGTAVDFAPIWVEVYFMQDGRPIRTRSLADPNAVGDTYTSLRHGAFEDQYRAFVAEAEFAQEVADGMKLKVGAVLDMRNCWQTADTDFNYVYKILAGFNAYGADFGLAFVGSDSDLEATGIVAVSAKYDITKYLSVQAGGKFMIGDVADNTDENFLGAEFGFSVKPGKVTYDIGYAIFNDKVAAWYATDSWGWGNIAVAGNPIGANNNNGPLGDSNYIAGWKGGLYFITTARF